MPPATSAYTTAAAASISLGRTPSYLITGGLVFLTLTREYMESEFKVKHMSEFDSWRDEFMLLAQSSSSRRFPSEEIVILSEVLAHPCNVGYENYRNLRIIECNDEPVKNLRHLKSLVESAADGGLRTAKGPSASKDGAHEKSSLISFTCFGGAKIVLDAQEVRSAQQQICLEHFIPSPYSPDLLE